MSDVQTTTIELPQLNNFLLSRYYDTRSPNPDDILNNVNSFQFAFRIVKYIAEHKGRFIQRSIEAIGAQFSMKPSSVKRVMSELVKHNEVSVQFRFMCREIDGVNKQVRAANKTSLVLPPQNWYTSNKWAVNYASAAELIRTRAYVLQILREQYPDHVFGDSFLFSGKLTHALNSQKDEFIKSDIYFSMVNICRFKGQILDQLLSINTKYLLEVLIKEKHYRFQGNELEKFAGRYNHPENQPNQKESDSNKSNELTAEPNHGNMHIPDNNNDEDQTMPKYEKIRAQKPSDKTPVTSDELIQKLNNGSGVKPSYKAKKNGDPMQPTSKKALAETCRTLNTIATKGKNPSPHYAHSAFIESMAKTIAESKGRSRPDYISAVKVVAFCMKNYAAYMMHLDPTSKSLNPNVNLKLVYRSAHIEDMFSFCHKNAAQFKLFSPSEWTAGTGQDAYIPSDSTTTGTTAPLNAKNAQVGAQGGNQETTNDLLNDLLG